MLASAPLLESHWVRAGTLTSVRHSAGGVNGMSIYDRYVLPRLLALAMRNRELVPYRQRVGGAAKGRVLEIGIGSGPNVPFYGPDVTEVVGVDPSPALVAMARARRSGLHFPFHVIEGTIERMQLEDNGFDTVLTTWSLCSVADPIQVLREARRVLRPGGQLLFVEHGRAPDAGVSRWQDRLTPGWKHLAGGCHLNRKMDDLVRDAGFRLDHLRTGYARGPRPMTFMYEGRARSG
jgi:ubiquinone/menaquinone biosynthesis C-methylase UbiE